MAFLKKREDEVRNPCEGKKQKPCQERSGTCKLISPMNISSEKFFELHFLHKFSMIVGYAVQV